MRDVRGHRLLAIGGAALLAACGGDGDGERTPLVDAGVVEDASVVEDADASDADAGSHDAGSSDAGSADASSDACTPFVMPDSERCAIPENAALPGDLACTGLYGDPAQRKLACGVIEYAPAFELWSDGAEKRRFVALPPGTRIDTSDPDAFVFPVGAKLWKEFRVRAPDGRMRLGETRLIQKVTGGWIYTSYVWSEDEQRAVQMDNDRGVPDLHGTGHTVPTRDQCGECHAGRKDFALGWDALMLGPGARGVTRDTLVSLGLAQRADTLALTIPGSEVERAALGYLHANCGVSCHNETAKAKARDARLYLRLEASELASVATTDAFRSGMNKLPEQNAELDGLALDPSRYVGIRPGDPARSLLLERQKIRGFEGQMPRIGTHRVDDVGVDLTTRWIESMRDNPAYPAPAP